MSEPSRINLNLGFMRTPDKGKDRRKLSKGQRPNTQITLKQVIEFIKLKALPAEQEARLIELASTRPSGSFYQFVKNWKKYLKPS